ncbi:MAG: NADH-quinone oxidoreductase subunit NuoN [Proteobacteria bacterium]|nr:NADH-quinone oxidoreductase subunit NuoN [Pseudomonadota bacterium]
MNWQDLQIVAPELFVLLMACGLLILDLFLSEQRRGILHLVSVLTMALAAIITLRGHPALEQTGAVMAFADTFVRDGMGDLLKVFAYMVMILVFVYSRYYLKQFNMYRSEFYSLSLFALLGAMVLISAASLITVYLGLELMALSLYAMVALKRDDRKATEAAMKYFILGSMASGMLLYGMSMIYGATGSLQISEISLAVAQQGSDNMILVFGLVFMVVALAFKFGLVPFHMWVPDLYEGAPAPVVLFISSMPKLAVFAMAIRLLQDGLSSLHTDWSGMLIVVAVLSIVLGNLAALAQKNIKRMLAYSTISHMGFVMLGLISGTATGFGASMFYVITYALMSAGSFGVIIFMSSKGIEAENLSDYKGLNQRNPWFAAMFAMLMLSMAGIPVFVGFFAKWLVIQAVVDAGLIWLALLAVVFSVIGGYYYLRVIKIMYFDKAVDENPIQAPSDFRAVLSVNALLMLVLGVFSSPLISACMAVF